MTSRPGPVAFGIIACSSIARRRMIPALQACPSARVQAIGSRSATRAAEYARLFSVEKSGIYESVLADPEVEAVYISTPVTEHAVCVRQAIAYGKHILCEKPAFTSREAAHEFVDLCRSRNVTLLEGYTFRYHPQHALVRSLVAEGRIGIPRFFSAEMTYQRPSDDDIRFNPALRGGVFFDSAGYPVAAARLILGTEPLSVSCNITSDRVPGIDNGVAFRLIFPGQVVAQLYAGFDLQYGSRYSLTGTAGRIDVHRAFSVLPDAPTTITLESSAGTETFSIDPTDHFVRMIESFTFAVRGDATLADSFAGELLRQQDVMSAALLSHSEKRTVDLKEVLS